MNGIHICVCQTEGATEPTTEKEEPEQGKIKRDELVSVMTSETPPVSFGVAVPFGVVVPFV